MAAGVTHDLDEYLVRASAAPWAWGVSDCTMFAADWVRLVTGRDPAETCRGRYASELGARKLMRDRGGFVALIRGEMERLGFERTDDPKAGDVGLIEVPVRYADRMPVVGPVAGIRAGNWWVAKGLASMQGGRFNLIMAWSVAP